MSMPAYALAHSDRAFLQLYNIIYVMIYIKGSNPTFEELIEFVHELPDLWYQVLMFVKCNP